MLGNNENMLKKIKVDQLVLGMHLKEFCGSWMEHPFWRTGFVLADAKDLTSIMSSGIKEVWIDSSKGLDVPSGTVAVSVSAAESDAQVEEELRQVAVVSRELAPVSTAAEIERATQICFRLSGL